MSTNFDWPIPTDLAGERIVNDVKRFGCHIIWIHDAAPQFAFSIGLFLNFEQPEIIIFGLDPETARIIINAIRDYSATGERFVAGTRTDRLLVHHDVYFLEVPVAMYPEYLGSAIWFYQSLARPFPCVQLVWPDGEGRFPWDPDYDDNFKQSQPILTHFP
jgi:uncharacterized protein DUF4262